MNQKAVNIAFFDISQMSGPMQALYLMVMYSAIAGCMYWFYRYLVKGPEEEEALRQAKVDAKKAKRAKKNQ